MQGYQEMVSARVTVFRQGDTPLVFGVYPGEGRYEMNGDNAPLLTLQWSRQLGQPGSAVFSLPGRTHHEVGVPWSDAISLRDFVQIEATVQRAPGPQGDADGYSHSWRGVFFGRVLEVDDLDVPDDEGFGFVTVVTCDDFLGSLEAPHFSYWRNLGQIFGVEGEEGAKLKKLQRAGFDQGHLEVASTSRAAEIILTAFIEGVFDISRNLKTASGITKLNLSDTYAYRFEGDDLQIGISLREVAPEAQSWRGAMDAVIDGPAFYEFFQDCVPRRDIKRTLAATTNGEVGRSAVSEVRVRKDPAAPRLQLPGDYVELLSVRPLPFPTYRTEINPSGQPTGRSFYSQAAWDSLETLEAAPFAHGNLRLNGSARQYFSVYSVNFVTSNFSGQDDASQANAQAQIAGDMEKLLHVTGYVPLDVNSKRMTVRGQTNTAALNSAKLSRILAEQLLSYNHLNDLYYNATSIIPLDLRVKLGVKWREADRLFYLEGYKHVITPEAASTTLTLSHGLLVEYYGLKPKDRPILKDRMDYIKKYLGRARPGQLAPKVGQELASSVGEKPKSGA